MSIGAAADPVLWAFSWQVTCSQTQWQAAKSVFIFPTADYRALLPFDQY